MRNLTLLVLLMNLFVLFGCGGDLSSKNISTTEDGTHLTLDNGTLRVKLNIESFGGAITYISKSCNKYNIINNFDRGRSIQQSYYAGQSLDRRDRGQNESWSPWSWNPIQVGDSWGNSSQVLEAKITNGIAYTKTIPMLWDMKNELAEAYMEQWTEIKDNTIYVKCKLTCFRSDTIWTQVPTSHQELPAVYTIADLPYLYTYVGDQPWEDKPLTRIVKTDKNNSFPWEYWTTDEKWAANVNSDGWGLGVYNKDATLFIGGLHGSEGGGTGDASTSYIAPLRTDAIGPETVYQYDYYLVVGTLDDIRKFVYNEHFSE